MAALGLGVDLRVFGQVGGKVTAAVTLSLAFLPGKLLAVITPVTATRSNGNKSHRQVFRRQFFTRNKAFHELQPYAGFHGSPEWCLIQSS